MSENDDPESTIPWPGFVDILSTVIIVFVFFMMMTSVIIFVLSEQAKKAAVSEAQKQSQSEVDQKDTKTTPEVTLSPDVSNLLMEKEALQKEVDKLTQLKNVLSESQDQNAGREGNVLTVHFGDLGATIVPDTEDVIKKQLPYEGHVLISSYIPRGSDFKSIREIALNRALNIRNVLLQGGIPNDHVAIKILAQPDEEGDAVMEATPDNLYGTVTLTFTN